MLEDCWERDNEWTKATVDYIKANTQLSETQIYKWGYDQKRKRCCKDGIRNKLREQKRRKMSDSETSDYNTMVDSLFPDVEVVSTRSETGLDLVSKLPQENYNDFCMGSRVHETGNGDQTKTGINLEKTPTLELVKSAPLGMFSGLENDISDYNNTTFEDHKFSVKENPMAAIVDVLSQFGDISDDQDRQFDFE